MGHKKEGCKIPVFQESAKKAETAVEVADPVLYEEIRIENTLTKNSGEEVHLKPSAKSGGHDQGRARSTRSEKLPASGTVRPCALAFTIPIPANQQLKSLP
jgi:hypothetical protein